MFVVTINDKPFIKVSSLEEAERICKQHRDKYWDIRGVAFSFRRKGLFESILSNFEKETMIEANRY